MPALVVCISALMPFGWLDSNMQTLIFYGNISDLHPHL
jgi:hypothetical protein